MIERFILAVILGMAQRTAQLLQFLSAPAVDEQAAVGAVSDGDLLPCGGRRGTIRSCPFTKAVRERKLHESEGTQ